MGRFLSEEEFSQQFTDFEHTAWKLEVRDRCDVAEETETIRHFLHTGDLGRKEDHALTSPGTATSPPPPNKARNGSGSASSPNL